MISTLKQKHVANNCASQETEGFASIANSRFSVGEVTQSGNTGAWPWQKAVFCQLGGTKDLVWSHPHEWPAGGCVCYLECLAGSALTQPESRAQGPPGKSEWKPQSSSA